MTTILFIGRPDHKESDEHLINQMEERHLNIVSSYPSHSDQEAINETINLAKADYIGAVIVSNLSYLTAEDDAHKDFAEKLSAAALRKPIFIYDPELTKTAKAQLPHGLRSPARTIKDAKQYVTLGFRIRDAVVSALQENSTGHIRHDYQ